MELNAAYADMMAIDCGWLVVWQALRGSQGGGIGIHVLCILKRVIAIVEAMHIRERVLSMTERYRIREIIRRVKPDTNARVLCIKT